MPNGNDAANRFLSWIQIQTNVPSPTVLNTTGNDISNTVYPATIPDSEWIYIGQVFATGRTPTLVSVTQLGYVKDALTMLLLFSDLTLVLQNGNPAMNRYFDWVRFARNAITVDDFGSDLSLLQTY
jgi:hypothetical protein